MRVENPAADFFAEFANFRGFEDGGSVGSDRVAFSLSPRFRSLPMRTLAFVLALASLSFAQSGDEPKSDPAAEALVKKLEDKVAAAKTLTMKLKMEVAVGGENMAFDVQIDVKDGNRVRLALSGKDPGSGSEISISATCDGKQSHLRSENGDEDRDAPADLADKVKGMVVRHPVKDLAETLAVEGASLPLEFSAWAFLPDEKIGDRTVRVVSYVASRKKMVLQMKLWIDAEKLELVKRELVDKDQSDGETRVTETFSAMTVGGEIPDETFKAPEKKGEK